MQLATSPLRDYMNQHMDGFGQAHMLTWPRTRAALGEFLLMVVPAVAFVLAVSWIESFRTAIYLQAAISEGIGPALHNVIGCFGLFLLGIAILLPRTRITRAAAHHVLATAFGIGALTFGLLLGQILVAVGSETVAVWQAWFMGVGIGVLFLFAALITFVAWYGALLTSPAAQQDGGFLHWWSHRPLRLRAAMALIVAAVPMIALSLER